MKSEPIAVVGATGKTGARVLAQLDQRGVNTRALARGTEIPFDWEDRNTWGPALKDVSAAFVTYFPDLAVPQAEDDIQAFVELAKQQGLKHLVLLSGRGEDGALRAEHVLQNSGLSWNVVRASWFMQNFSESFMLQGIQSGELVLPEPRASEPFIDVDDIADVVVAALLNPELHNQLLEITGPQLMTFSECISAIANATGRDIRFTPVPLGAYLEGAKTQGLTDEMAWLINELFLNVLDGRNACTTRTVEQVLGRPARSFHNYVLETLPTDVWVSPVSAQHSG